MSKSENRDPITCTKCGTVNAWNAGKCRECGQEIARQVESFESNGDISVLPEGEAPPPTPPPEEAADCSLLRSDDDGESGESPPQGTHQPEKRRWNIFWIVLGIALHVVAIHIGVFAVIKTIEQDKALKTVVEQILNASQLSDNTEENKIYANAPEPIKSKLNRVRGVLLLLLVLTPVVIGAAIGYFSGSVLEGAAAMGLSAILIPLLNNAALFAVLWGPVNAVLGALGAYLACRMKQRLRDQTTSTLVDR